MAEATDAVMAMAEKNIHSSTGSYDIFVRDGVYYADRTTVIDDANGYLGGDSINIVGESAENTIIKGSKKISSEDFLKVTNSDVLEKVSEELRDDLYSVDLVEKGYLISETDEFEIMLNDAPGTVARFPNDDGVLSSEDWMKYGEVAVDGAKKSFGFKHDRMSCWEKEGNVTVKGLFNDEQRDYIYDALVENGAFTIDTEDKINNDNWFMIYNELCELDLENEYCYDEDNSVLYMLNPLGKDIEIQVEGMNLFKIRYASNVTIKDLTLTNAYDTFIRIIANDENAAEYNTIDNCVMKNGSMSAVQISGKRSYKNTVKNCIVYDLGSGGIITSSGDRTYLTGGCDYIYNNLIHDYQRRDKFYASAIGLSGVGHIAENNTIYNGYHLAMTMYGNDMQINKNEIHHVCMETSDMGAIYGYGYWNLRGNTISENYFHDMPFNRYGWGSNAIYLDGGLSGTYVTKNIFENIKRHGVYINGGRDNIIDDNIFIDIDNSFAYDFPIAFSDCINWGHKYNENYIPEERDLYSNLMEVPYQSENFSKYEHLSDILEDEPALPKYNKFTNNQYYNFAGMVNSSWIRSTDEDGNTVGLKGFLEYCECDFSTGNKIVKAEYSTEGIGRQD